MGNYSGTHPTSQPSRRTLRPRVTSPQSSHLCHRRRLPPTVSFHPHLSPSAINDFARFDPNTFQREWLCSLYVCLMSYTVCHIFLTTILGMCITVTLATLQQYDEAHKAEFFRSGSGCRDSLEMLHFLQRGVHVCLPFTRSAALVGLPCAVPTIYQWYSLLVVLVSSFADSSPSRLDRSVPPRSSPSTWKRNARSNHEYQEALGMVGLKNKKRHLGRELAEGVFLPTAYHFMMHTCDFAGSGPTRQRRLSFHGISVPRIAVPFRKQPSLNGGGPNVSHHPLGEAVDTAEDSEKPGSRSCEWFPGCGMFTGQLYCKVSRRVHARVHVCKHVSRMHAFCMHECKSGPSVSGGIGVHRKFD